VIADHTPLSRLHGDAQISNQSVRHEAHDPLMLHHDWPYTADPGAVHAQEIRTQDYVRAHIAWAAKARHLLDVYQWSLEGNPVKRPILFDDALRSAESV